MRTIAPNYFHSFACLMGGCRHSCCVGWEIDVDEDALNRYRAVTGPLGTRLAENIRTDGESPCFRLTADERCPFLNASGLCELILELGEDSLCQICADHPRFRNGFSDRTELGLGLCCEAAGRLILTRRTPVRLIALADDGIRGALLAEERWLLGLRGQLFAIVQNRGLPLERRVQQMLATANIPMPDTSARLWADFLLDLERMDEAWTERLQALANVPVCSEVFLHTPEWENAFEQLLVYLLYRHLPGALDDGDIGGRIQYAALIWRLTAQLCAVHAAQHSQISLDDLIEIARLYSSEIEYSDENLDAILNRLQEI